jgi:osmoprotectant transport system ATP-binding protein
VRWDSAQTSPFGLAVAVTADTGRYAGVVSADAILDKVRDVRTSVAESISIREAEAAFEYEPAAESDAEYDDIGEDRLCRGDLGRTLNSRNKRPNPSSLNKPSRCGQSPREA